jgi:hypothetical protein
LGTICAKPGSRCSALDASKTCKNYFYYADSSCHCNCVQ